VGLAQILILALLVLPLEAYLENCIQWGAQFQGETSGIACHYFYRCKFDHASANRGKPIYPRDAGHGFRMNDNARDCVFEECEFSQNDGYGLQFGGSGLDGFTLLRCEITEKQEGGDGRLAGLHETGMG
jgi:hypothetical protein